MRHLYNDLLRLRGLPCENDFDANAGVCYDSSLAFTYTAVTYGSYWPNRQSLPFGINIYSLADDTVAHCDTIVVNIGHWHAGWVTGFALSPQKYKEDVEAILHWIIARKKPAAAILFLSNNPMPLQNRITVCPAQDWRSDPVIVSYNDVAELAVELLHSHHAHFVNTFWITQVVSDLSFDWNHFNGTVGRAIATFVWFRAISLQNVSESSHPT